MISAATGLMLFRELVRTNSSIMALLRGGIHISRTPQPDRLPYATIDMITVQPTDTKDGPSPMDSISIQLDIYAPLEDNGDTLSGYVAAAAIEEAIRNHVDGFIGDVKNITIDEIRWVTQNPAPFEDENDAYRVSVDYLMRLNRAQ